MALIKKDLLEKIERSGNLQEPVVSKMFTGEARGKKFLQIDTYGRPDRKYTNKVSQTMQFDSESAKYLADEIHKFFDEKKTVPAISHSFNSTQTKSVLAYIQHYISASGFSYPSGMIENFYLSLKSKPFVILAGTSGTGKTRLVKLFAEAIGAKYQLVPVRPDWSDSSDLFGHVDLNGTFIPGPVIQFVKDASENPNQPYILCLDEMNLARVEYYLSDVLSVIETRDLKDGKITSDPLIDVDKYGSDAGAINEYGKLLYPENLYIVGTVNMDETTFPFSKKVLDRANTIEFNYVDLADPFSDDIVAEKPEKKHLSNDFLRSQYLLLEQCRDEKDEVVKICKELQAINEFLRGANLHVGYRVRDEICFYMLNNKHAELLSYEQAMDNVIMQKILPRVQGSSVAIEEMLKDLAKYLGDKYPKSKEKIDMMLSRFEEDGFTSYWL